MFAAKSSWNCFEMPPATLRSRLRRFETALRANLTSGELGQESTNRESSTSRSSVEISMQNALFNTETERNSGHFGRVGLSLRALTNPLETFSRFELSASGTMKLPRELISPSDGAMADNCGVRAFQNGRHSHTDRAEKMSTRSSALRCQETGAHSLRASYSSVVAVDLRCSVTPLLSRQNVTGSLNA
jgi:hypothetical protein